MSGTCAWCGGLIADPDLHGYCCDQMERIYAPFDRAITADPSFAPGAKRRVFEPESDLLERKEVRSLRELMEAAALADAGTPQSLIVRGPLSDDDE
jgi:hypothetical protein